MIHISSNGGHTTIMFFVPYAQIRQNRISYIHNGEIINVLNNFIEENKEDIFSDIKEEILHN